MLLVNHAIKGQFAEELCCKGTFSQRNYVISDNFTKEL